MNGTLMNFNEPKYLKCNPQVSANAFLSAINAYKQNAQSGINNPYRCVTSEISSEEVAITATNRCVQNGSVGAQISSSSSFA